MFTIPHYLKKYRYIGAAILLAILFTGKFQKATAQTDSLQIQVHGVAVYSSGDLVPLWLHTNQFGKIDQFGQGQLLSRINSEYERNWENDFSISAGLDFWMDNNLDKITPGQLFVKLDYRNFSLIAGKKNLHYLPGQENEPLFLNFRNIRPMPAVSFGFFEYTLVPFTKNYLQFRASFLQGKLNDKREAPGITNPWYHFKNLYLKTGNLPVNAFAGLNHSVLFGGTMSDGTKIPVDWYNTFVANPSEKLEEFMWGEGANTPGEHVGFSEFGLEFVAEKFTLSISKQDPFTDYWGLFRSKDKILILNFSMNKRNWIEKISYQYGYTKHQSGPGLHLRSYKNVEDYSLFLKENFGLDVEVITWEEFHPYLVEYVNQGHSEFGRDNFFNHGVYKLGHFYDGHFYGYPLMHSNRQINYFRNIDDFNYQIIGNNRLWSHHFLAEGTINPKLTYTARATFTKNYGTYRGFYTSGFNERPDYYFREGKKQNYFLLELTQQLPRNFSANAAMGFDSGELYNSFGIRLGISWNISPLK